MSAKKLLGNKMKNPSSKYHLEEIPAIEFLRFFSALMILVFHYVHFTYKGTSLPQNLSNLNLPFYNFLWIFYEFGKYAVQIFWSISGFIFFLKYKNLIADKLISAKDFFILRLSRLYPLHFLTLLIVLFLQIIYLKQTGLYFINQHNDLPHFLLQLFLASDWEILRGTGFNAPIWSVSVEVITYAIFFASLRFIGKSAYMKVMMIFVCLLLNAIGFKSSILGCIKYFYAGGLAAFAYEFRNKIKRMDSLMLLLLFMLLPLTIFMSYILQIKIKSYVFFILLCTPIVIYFLATKLKLSPSIINLSKKLGNLTYASYLIHFPIQLSFMIYFNSKNEAAPYQNPYFLFVYIGVTLILAWFIFNFYEKPLQDYIRKIWQTKSY